MRHPGTYLGLAMPDPTLSEFRKGTRGSPTPTLELIGSGSRLRASQRDCSTMARSPSGERRPLMSRRATTPLLRPVATPAASLARSGGDSGRETNDARVLWGASRSAVLMRRESRVNVHRRWMAHSLLGQMRPRWAKSFADQAFAAF
jgi:hypothetical protein